MQVRRIITIQNRATQQLIAEGIEGETVRLFEGAWYFDKTAVDPKDLIFTERTYICPYKGTCYWIDIMTPSGIVQDAAFTYFQVKPGYEFIQDRIGFYAGLHQATVQKAAVLNEATR